VFEETTFLKVYLKLNQCKTSADIETKFNKCTAYCCLEKWI